MYISVKATDEGHVVLNDILPSDLPASREKPTGYYGGSRTNEVKVEAAFNLGSLRVCFEKWIPATDELVSRLSEENQAEYAKFKAEHPKG